MIGDTVGDPLKDTSGPSLNILIKLMAVESLVFAPFFQAHTPNGESLFHTAQGSHMAGSPTVCLGVGVDSSCSQHSRPDT